MEGRAQEVWGNALERIRQAVSRQVYDTWFTGSRGSRLSAETMEVEVPNRFVADWLRDHYLALIEESVQRESDKRLGVSFVVPPAPAPRSEPEPGNSAMMIAVSEAFPTGADTALAGAQPPESWRLLPSAPERPVRRGGGTPPAPEAELDPRYTFSNFVAGGGNRFAHAACLAVAEAPAQRYNPLFIYGGVGLGKTHLMQAIGNALRAGAARKVVCYVSAETFMNEMIYAIQHACTYDFRRKYRSVDLLLIDDIQFLSGKESTQEEFFHTFNSLYAARKQIVLTSDRLPKEIPALEDRLISRFQWGLITDIQAPDLETRVAILRHKMEQEGVQLPSEVLLLIARRAKSNIRELEGALIRLLAHSSVSGAEISLDTAEEILKDFLASTPRHITIEEVQRAVSNYYRLPLEIMRARKRTAAVAVPRQIAMYLCRELTALSLADIGSRFGGRDHTTVLHACEKIAGALTEDRELRSAVERIMTSLEGTPASA